MTEGDGSQPVSALAIQDSLRVYEHHFNELEHKVRQMASLWILATFSAIAFVVRGELGENGLLGPMPLLGLIALFGNVGLLTLWCLDQRVYHRLLAAGFELGLELERDHPEMIPIRNLMWVKSGAVGMGRFAAMFYAAPMTVNAVVGLVAALSQWPDDWSIGLLPAAAAVTGAAIPLCFLHPSILKESTVDYSFDEAVDVVDKWRNRDSARSAEEHDDADGLRLSQ